MSENIMEIQLVQSLIWSSPLISAEKLLRTGLETKLLKQTGPYNNGPSTVPDACMGHLAMPCLELVRLMHSGQTNGLGWSRIVNARG